MRSELFARERTMNIQPRQVGTLAVMGMIAAGSLANAAWMLGAPLHWYETVPGVSDFGPYNAHFVRDIGCTYLTVSLALTWALFTSRHRLPLVTMVALFHGAHALLHIFDTALGHVSPHHWWLDLPTIYLPALLLAAILLTIRSSAGRA